MCEGIYPQWKVRTWVPPLKVPQCPCLRQKRGRNPETCPQVISVIFPRPSLPHASPPPGADEPSTVVHQESATCPLIHKSRQTLDTSDGLTPHSRSSCPPFSLPHLVLDCLPNSPPFSPTTTTTPSPETHATSTGIPERSSRSPPSIPREWLLGMNRAPRWASSKHLPPSHSYRHPARCTRHYFPPRQQPRPPRIRPR